MKLSKTKFNKKITSSWKTFLSQEFLKNFNRRNQMDLEFNKISDVKSNSNQKTSTVQSRFSDILFSDKSRFSDNFAEDHFSST